eukprot:m.61373 g.61373  ORF g.61373 m.61373 type:complete len:158 (-) comp22972_c0_seq2:195-668(-)
MALRLGASSFALGVGVYLAANKPDTTQFRKFLQKWLTEQQRNQSDDEQPSSSSSGRFMGFITQSVNSLRNQVEELTAAAIALNATVTIKDVGVCAVATADIITADGNFTVAFIGVHGDWHYVPKDVLDKAMEVGAYSGMGLAMLSIASVVSRPFRRR